uniref:Uncharacterized protein n=1 Tax=Tanacetum cinerariifolium TaxID=118510 RepID=A0A699HA87_TANCI|nr:hypothetical protein [Tanacetum cinerariifolium]
MTDNEVVMSEQEESNHAHTQNIKHFEEKDDVDKWLNAEIAKHMNMQGVENIEDALISIIKTIRKEMKDDIMKGQFEASTASISNETSSSNEEDKDDNNTSLPHHETLRRWICFHDHERQTVKGSHMGFVDFLQQKCQQNYKETNETWYDKGYEEDELWRSGDEKTNYNPPYVNVKTLEVNKYSFNEGRSFIYITDREDEALTLGRVNGARFKAMIRKELEGNKYVHEETKNEHESNLKTRE